MLSCCCCCQVVIALTGRELVYFEMDPSGQLNEYTERKEMTSDIICMALGPVPASEQRSRFLAVGLADNTVRIISLDPSVSHRCQGSCRCCCCRCISAAVFGGDHYFQMFQLGLSRVPCLLTCSLILLCIFNCRYFVLFWLASLLLWQ